jgi:hypothetical protein
MTLFSDSHIGFSRGVIEKFLKINLFYNLCTILLLGLFKVLLVYRYQRGPSTAVITKGSIIGTYLYDD